ncbi:hypothetical protein NM208_g12946 [Fusarium decemcellulare]|uniref:Uncharacterized protein n=1 Tax=Fusarium decemcellulare TaxID=57161 RepID=A0ACC1RP76_9HYPO|nr:hypothetical protein NM208_g12946 [Fusarium decemcellulare]
MPPRKTRQTTRKPATSAQGRSPLTPVTPIPPRGDANGPDAPSSGATGPASRTGARAPKEPMMPTPDTEKENNEFDIKTLTASNPSRLNKPASARRLAFSKAMAEIENTPLSAAKEAQEEEFEEQLNIASALGDFNKGKPFSADCNDDPDFGLDDDLIQDFVDFEEDDVPLPVDEEIDEEDEEDANQPRKRARCSTDRTAEQWIESCNDEYPVSDDDQDLRRFQNHLKCLVERLRDWARFGTEGPISAWMKLNRSERAMARGFRNILIHAVEQQLIDNLLVYMPRKSQQILGKENLSELISWAFHGSPACSYTGSRI